MRTIVQITSITFQDGSPGLFALCEDGSLWLRAHLSTGWGEWKRSKGITEKEGDEVV